MDNTYSILILINIVRTIIEIYLAIAFGHLFNKNRILLSFAIYLGINTVSQIVYFMVLPLIARPFMKFVISVDSMPDFSLTDGLQFLSNVDSQLTLFTVFILVASAVLSAGYFLVTNYRSNHKS